MIHLLIQMRRFQIQIPSEASYNNDGNIFAKLFGFLGFGVRIIAQFHHHNYQLVRLLSEDSEKTLLGWLFDGFVL